LKQLFILTFCIIFGGKIFAQKDSASITQKKDTAVFNRKQEIVYDGKRYRVHNSWLSIGAGANYNTKWPKDEKNIAVDFSFFVKQHHFRLGGFMSGTDFTATNNYSFHLGYGLRKEREKYNLSAFIGPSTSFLRRPLSDSSNYNLGTVYNAVGGYAVIEAVYKVKYDVGIGGQIFCDYNQIQMVYGARIIVYLSGAYRGIKYGYRAPAKKKK
jgi:hypothetical protein